MEWRYYNIIAMHGILVVCNWNQVSVSVSVPILVSVLVQVSVSFSVPVPNFGIGEPMPGVELYRFRCRMFFCPKSQKWDIEWPIWVLVSVSRRIQKPGFGRTLVLFWLFWQILDFVLDSFFIKAIETSFYILKFRVCFWKEIP